MKSGIPVPSVKSSHPISDHKIVSVEFDDDESQDDSLEQNLLDFHKQYKLIETALQEDKCESTVPMVNEIYKLAKRIDVALDGILDNDVTYGQRVVALKIKAEIQLAKHAAARHDYANCAHFYSDIIQHKPFKVEYYIERSNAYGKLGDSKKLKNDIFIIRELRHALPDFIVMDIPKELDQYMRTLHSTTEIVSILKNAESALDLFHKAYHHFRVQQSSASSPSDSIDSLNGTIAYIENQLGILYGSTRQFDRAYDFFTKAFMNASSINDPVLMFMCGINQVISGFHLRNPGYLKGSINIIKSLANADLYQQMVKEMVDQDTIIKQYIDLVFNLSQRFYMYHHILFENPILVEITAQCMEAAIEIVKGYPVHVTLLGEYYSILGEFHKKHLQNEKAIATHSEAISMLEQRKDGRSYESLIERHRFARGKIYEVMNVKDKALDDYMAVVKINRTNMDAAERIAILVKQQLPTTTQVEAKPKQKVIKPKEPSQPEKNKPVAIVKIDEPVKSQEATAEVVEVKEEKETKSLSADRERIKQVKLQKSNLRKERLVEINKAKLVEITAHLSKSESLKMMLSKKLTQSDQAVQCLLDQSIKENGTHLELDPIKQQRALADGIFIKIDDQRQLINEALSKAKADFNSVSHSLFVSRAVVQEIKELSSILSNMIGTIDSLIENEKTKQQARIAHVQEQLRLAEEKMTVTRNAAIAATFSIPDFKKLLALSDALNKAGFKFTINGGAVTKYAMHLFASTPIDKDRISAIKLNDIDMTIEAKSINDPALIQILVNKPFKFKSANGKINRYFANYIVKNNHIFDLTVRDEKQYQSHNPIRLTRAFLSFSGQQLILNDPFHELKDGIEKKIFEIDLPDPKDPYTKGFFALLLKNYYKFDKQQFKLGKNAEVALYGASWQTKYFLEKFKSLGHIEITSEHPCIAEMADILKKGYILQYQARHIILSFIDAYYTYRYGISDLMFNHRVYNNLCVYYKSLGSTIESADASTLKGNFLNLLESQLYRPVAKPGSMSEPLVSDRYQALLSTQGMFKQSCQVMTSISRGQLPSRYVPS